MKKSNTTIQQKLMRIVLITCGIVVLLTCTVFVIYQFVTSKKTAKVQLSIISEIVAANSTAALAFQDAELGRENLQSLEAESHIAVACLYDTSGNIFVKYPDTISNASFPAIPEAEGFFSEGTYLHGYTKIIQGDIWVGTLYLKSDLKAVYQTFVRYALIALLVFALAILFAFILSKRLQKSISEPILALSKTAQMVSSSQDYTIRARKYENDELGLLTDAFNNMLGQIDRQNAEILSFNQDLELKVKQRTNELEQAIAELKLQTEFAETIIDSSVEAIAVFDTDLNYVLLNKYGQKMYNVHAEDVLGKNIIEVFPNLDKSLMHNSLKSALQGQMVHLPKYKSAVSSAILENYFIPLLDRDNKVYSILVVGHDITSIIEGNEKLRDLNLSLENSNRELEHSNRDLEQFAYITSHDLQEPLRKIRIFSARLEKTLDDKEATTKNLSKIISSATRMSDLINGVLNYSRLAENLNEWESVSLDELIQNFKTDFELTIAEKMAIIEAGELPTITGNKFQLNQLFTNLLSNSLKFSKKAPRIKVNSRILYGSEIPAFKNINPDIEYVLLEFIDNGIGFSQEFAQRVFTVFQRLHSRDDYPGTGIGLALCKKIVDKHNGTITVESKEEVGTTFYIYLPVDQKFE